MNKVKEVFIYNKEEAVRHSFMEGREYRSSALLIKKTKKNTYALTQIFLLTLSSELFIKCLIINNYQRYYKTHSLKYLFDKLTSVQQNEIIKQLNIKPENIINPFTEEILLEIKTHYDLFDFLDNYFVDIRYEFATFDKGNPSVYLFDYVHSLNNILFEMSKNVVDNYIKK